MHCRMLFYIIVLIFGTAARVKFSFGQDLNSTGGENSSDELFETQHTVCQINTLQLAATAKATVTRALKGVCLAKSIEEQFKRVETLLRDQHNLIKKLETKIDSIIPTTVRSSNFVATSAIPWELKDVEEFKHNENNVNLKENPRGVEIRRNNGTLHYESNGKRTFAYYWKIDEIKHKLTLTKKSIRSSNFYITPTGYCMYVRLFPTLNGDTIYVQVGLTHGEYDETLLWPFNLKHKLSLLEQTVINYNDISSRVWDPKVLCSELHWHKPSVKNDNYECVGLGISYESLFKKFYVYNDSLLVKLTVYLE